MQTYTPQAIDTSSISLPDEITALGELLAKNTHEIWTKQRIADGWSYGAVRNDELKQHPCLVEYEALEESEKVYDRNTSIETLKAICALGYRITKD